MKITGRVFGTAKDPVNRRHNYEELFNGFFVYYVVLRSIFSVYIGFYGTISADFIFFSFPIGFCRLLSVQSISLGFAWYVFGFFGHRFEPRSLLKPLRDFDAFFFIACF